MSTENDATKSENLIQDVSYKNDGDIKHDSNDSCNDDTATLHTSTEIVMSNTETEGDPSALVTETMTEKEDELESDQVIHLVEDINPVANTRKEIIRKITFTACCIGFVLFLGLFINEVFIQPARTNKVINEINDMYRKPFITPSRKPVKVDTDNNIENKENNTLASEAAEPEEVVKKDPNRDEQGRLLVFQSLLETNEDVKGWITIPDTNMDYVVMQSGKEDPEFYLFKNIYKEYDKAGSLFLDIKSSVETDTQAKVIHGHNMTSTDNMFHYLLDYKETDFFKKRPVIQFDTIYEQAQWKVFSVFITNGNSNNEPLFDYTRSSFTDASDFLNFIQDIKLRSYYHTDGIDINENDDILVLSTCSYELWDYRTVVVARKVREGEDPTVEVDGIIRKDTDEILYPETWYRENGGHKPEDISFEDALNSGSAVWYVPTVAN